MARGVIFPRPYPRSVLMRVCRCVRVCRARHVFGVCGCSRPRSVASLLRSVVSPREEGWDGHNCRSQASSVHSGLGLPDIRYLRDLVVNLEPGDTDRLGYEAWASRRCTYDAHGRGLVLSGGGPLGPAEIVKDWPVAPFRPALIGERSAPQDSFLSVPTSWGTPPSPDAPRPAVRKFDRHVGMR